MLDWMSGPNRLENLVWVNGLGEVVWRAELPSKDPVDFYTAVTLGATRDLVAWSWSGFKVILEGETGAIRVRGERSR